jgi:hypothetical protein
MAGAETLVFDELPGATGRVRVERWGGELWVADWALAEDCGRRANGSVIDQSAEDARDSANELIRALVKRWYA